MSSLSDYRLPNMQWGWRMPLRRMSWQVAWWLMRRVTMRGYTPYQQARMIDEAIAPYRPQVYAGTGSANITVRFSPEIDPPGSGPFGF